MTKHEGSMRLAGNKRDLDRPTGVHSSETSFIASPVMRMKHSALILTAGFLLIPTLTWSQGPGRGNWNGGGFGGGDRGGFGGGGGPGFGGAAPGFGGGNAPGFGGAAPGF